MEGEKWGLVLQKIKEAIADMQDKVVYTDDGHTYQLKETGTWLQGVSSVSSIVPKDWMPAWGAKEAVKFLGYSDYEGDEKKAKEMIDKIKELEPKEFMEVLKKAKGACYRKSKKALVDGKAGHAWLEKYIKATINKNTLPEIPNGNLKRPITQFLEWEKENIEKWVLSEEIVANPDRWYAGTLDGLAILKDGKLAIIDFKFSNRISEDYYLQTAGYQATFEPYNIRIDERIIIRLPKTIEKEVWNEKERKYEMVENNIEVVRIQTDYEEDRDVFFHCLPLKRWINKITKMKL